MLTASASSTAAATAALATFRRLAADPRLGAALAGATDGHSPADLSARLAEALQAAGGDVGLVELAVQGARLLTDPAAWLGDAPELVFDLATLNHGGGGPVQPAGQVRLTRTEAPDGTPGGRCAYHAADSTITALRLDAGRLVDTAATDPEASPLCLYLGLAGGSAPDKAAPVLVGNLGDRPALGLADVGARQQAFSADDVKDNLVDYWWAYLLGVLGFIAIVGGTVAVVRRRRQGQDLQPGTAVRLSDKGLIARLTAPDRAFLDSLARYQPDVQTPIDRKRQQLGDQAISDVNAALQQVGAAELTEVEQQFVRNDLENALKYLYEDAGAWMVDWEVSRRNHFAGGQANKIRAKRQPEPEPPQRNRRRDPEPHRAERETSARLYDEAITEMRRGLTDQGYTEQWIDQALDNHKDALISQFMRTLGGPGETEGENWIADWIRPWVEERRGAYIQGWIAELPRLEPPPGDESDDLVLSIELTEEEAAKWDELVGKLPDRAQQRVELPPAQVKQDLRRVTTNPRQAIERLAVTTGLQGQGPQTRQDRFANLRKIQGDLDRLERETNADQERKPGETRQQRKDRLEAERQALAQQEQAAQLLEIQDSMQVLSNSAALGVTRDDTKEYEGLLQLQTQVAAIDPGNSQAAEQLRSSAAQIDFINASIVLQSNRQGANLGRSQRLENQQAEDDYRKQAEEIQDLDRKQSPGAHERSRERYTEK